MNDEHADVTFVVENQKIPAHKTILSLRSSYFRSLFGGAFAESAQAEVELEVPVDAFKAILKYMYTGCLSLAALESHQIIEVYDLAEQYDFSASMKKIILDYLTANLTLDNCGSMLNAAHLYSIKDLQTACMKFMDCHSMELLDHDSLKALPVDSLCTLLKRDSFYAPEIEIFKAVCNWSTHNPGADVKAALSTVRWSELSANDLLNVVFPSSVLDRMQLLNLMEGCNKLSNANSRVSCSKSEIEENFATPELGAKTISGENPSALLSGNFTDFDWKTGYTYHPITRGIINKITEAPLSSCITVDLGKIRFINNIKFLLMDEDSRSYSYYVDVSVDGKEYTRLFDYSEHYNRSWQDLYFNSRPVRFIKLVGTWATGLEESRTDCSYDDKYYISYDSFDILGLRAVYTTNYPDLVDGVIKPAKNVAKVECGALVEGGGGTNMLNLNLDEFTCHEKNRYILLQLNQPYHIGSLRMLLGNSMNHSNKYSFLIETSMNKGTWTMAVDKRNEYLTGWQEFDFAPRSAIFIKITGTQSDINFICTYFECPRNPQKPKLERPLQ
ncbi:BTB/POZ domain-containing protein 9-like [Sitodiplosis mosellana]|uniref:BTB/POZ domain-containing protein 9-like n=1 Tax=Sitodiplosis mosellana TaxID=263140 RepID=UPI002444663B|nr:BTB/POZ domain-containing protein 9-like [Sitodiplosis mosellana]